MATIGVFDGVHLGHQALINRAVSLAEQRGMPSVLLTFDPHPAEVVRPGSHPAQLTTLRRKAELVERMGIDVFCVLPFTHELSKVPADEFVHEVLVEQLHVAAVVVGQNFTFGHGALGKVDLLTELGQRFGFVAEGAKLVTVPNAVPDAVPNAVPSHEAADEITFSSTYIRACVNAGDVTAAAAALGRPHRLEGIVVRGDRRGHELGFPTANLSTPRYAAVPADGVYAGRFSLLNNANRPPLMAAISVGTNPTFSGRERRVEAFVLDVDEDLYGQRIGVDFVQRLRPMERFDSSAALVEQMHDDVRRTRELLT
ncbi:bifunctional riboflavin kinase/FAD synthetase [Actinophytocola sediminis]